MDNKAETEAKLEVEVSLCQLFWTLSARQAEPDRATSSHWLELRRCVSSGARQVQLSEPSKLSRLYVN